MPIRENTRAQRATELRERLLRGPSGPFDQRTITGVNLTPDQRYAEYKLWIETWVIPELDDLVPELRKKQKGGKREAS